MESFGEYMKQLRLDCGLSLRDMASRLSLSVTYYRDVETGRRLPMDWEKLEHFARIVGLDRAEKDCLMDLAAAARGTVAPDIAGYVNGQDCVRNALRTACAVHAGCEDWQRFAAQLQTRNF